MGHQKDKIDKPLARLTERILKIRDAREKIMTNTTETQNTIKDYYEQLYANKFENLEEMDKSPNTYIIPRPNHEVIRKPE
jgi:deoxyadenosine/deoxycytidine kinase